MNIKIFTLFITSCLFFNIAIAQPHVISYYKNSGKLVQQRDSADYERIVTKPDSGSTLFNVTEKYLNGQIKCTGKSTKIPSNIWEGEYTGYYPSGKKQKSAFYKNGRLSGTFTEYYPNGTLYCVKEYDAASEGGNGTGHFRGYHYLIKTCNDSSGRSTLKEGNGHYIGYSEGFKHIFEEGDVKNGELNGYWVGQTTIGKDSIVFKEKYEDGVLVDGKSFKDGQTYTYTNRESYPEYIGGEAAFGQFLRDNIRYPPEAKKNNIQGRVFISFVVKKDGTLADIKIMRAPSDDLGQEAFNVISMSPNWKPGLLYGQPVSVQYTVPVNFSLRN